MWHLAYDPFEPPKWDQPFFSHHTSPSTSHETMQAYSVTHLWVWGHLWGQRTPPPTVEGKAGVLKTQIIRANAGRLKLHSYDTPIFLTGRLGKARRVFHAAESGHAQGFGPWTAALFDDGPFLSWTGRRESKTRVDWQGGSIVLRGIREPHEWALVEGWIRSYIPRELKIRYLLVDQPPFQLDSANEWRERIGQDEWGTQFKYWT